MKPILLIDLSALFHPSWRANENGPVSVAFDGTLGGVRRAISMCPDAAVAICCDGKGNWRKELTPTYKAKRDPLPEVFYSELDRVKRRLRDDGLLLWQVDGFEADDIIATAAKHAETGVPVTIATHDKDMFQLVSEHDTVRVLSLSSWQFRGEADVVQKFGVPPAKIGDWLALVGDASDNVPGAPGVGPVKAAELLTAYGDLKGVFAAAYDERSDMKPAVRKSLRENADQVELARKLVTLRTDVPIRFEEIYETREQKPLAEVTDMDDAAPEEIDAEPEQPSAKVKGASQGVAGQELAKIEEPSHLVAVEYTKALEPHSFRDALIACRVLFNSRLYQKYKSPEAMAAVVMRGREMGYGAGASLDGFHVISQTGALAMHAHMIMDRAMQHPDCEYLDCIESDATHCVYEGKKKSSNRPFKLEYTIEDAKRAGLVRSGSNWELRPTEQLRKTCGVQVSRVLWPGAAMGLYCMSELGVDE